MNYCMYLAEQHDPLAKHDKKLVSAAESLSSSRRRNFRGGLHPKPLIMDNIVYRAMLCIRGTSHEPVSVYLSVSVSVTSRCFTKTAKRRITQITPHDSPGTLVFWCQRSPRNSTGVTPYEGAECRWGGLNRRLSTNSRLYLENGKR